MKYSYHHLEIELPFGAKTTKNKHKESFDTRLTLHLTPLLACGCLEKKNGINYGDIALALYISKAAVYFFFNL